MSPLQFAGLIAIPFLVAHYFIVKNENNNFKILLWLVIAIKLFVALTMGNFDLFGFISFIQNFIDNPSQNPWIFTQQTVYAKFHYPPVVMYIHAFVMFCFKPFLNLDYPYWPTPYSYSLFRIPFLIVDMLFLKFFLCARKTSNSKAAFLFYLLNPFLFIQEYYSGEIDWIAIFPFFFAILEFEKNKLSKKFIIFLTISFLLKPFGLIFLPLILLELVPDVLKNPSKFFKYAGLFSIPFLIWKLSEIPYIFSPEYKTDFGAGASERIIGNSHFFPIPLFAVAYISLIIYWLIAKTKNRSRSISEKIVIITLLFAALGHPIYGWLLWGLPFAIKLILEKKINFLTLWWIWSFIFLIKSFTVMQGPFFSSFGLFVTYFLKFDYSFPLGAPALYLKEHFGYQTASIIQNSIGFLWRLINLLLACLILKDKSFLMFNKKFLSIQIMLILFLTGCSLDSKRSCADQYVYTFLIKGKALKNTVEHSMSCCFSNIDSSHPYCIPENRDLIVPLVYPENFEGQEIEYTIIENKSQKSRSFKYKN